MSDGGHEPAMEEAHEEEQEAAVASEPTMADAEAEAAAAAAAAAAAEADRSKLRVVVEGCGHGELDQIYASIGRLEAAGSKKVDLLICCGDFQAVRNREDLQAMNVPAKYLTMASFHKYYSGEAVAPVLTLFIGGNHEASNHLQELYYGGWVAPNIYYLGCSGVVRVGGVRIAGLSGIFNGRHYRRGHYEAPPYSPDTIRSIYHVREVEVFKLAQLRDPVDVGLSHDWPRGVYHHGDLRALLRAKPFFQKECEENTLGSEAAEFLLNQLRPAYWFAGHLHCKFAAVVRHPGPDHKLTRFLALDKCLPNRDFLQLVEIPRPEGEAGRPVRLEHDLEWLAIVKATHGLLSRSDREVVLPREVPLVTEEDKEWVRRKLATACKARGRDPATDALVIPPESFERTAPVHDPTAPPPPRGSGGLMGSPQTDALLAALELGHRVTVPYQRQDAPTLPPAAAASAGAAASAEGGEGGGGEEEAPLFFLDRGDGSKDPNAIDLDDDDDDNDEGGNGNENGDEGDDVVVYKAGQQPQEQQKEGGQEAPPPPPPSRPRLVLPPPSSSSSAVE